VADFFTVYVTIKSFTVYIYLKICFNRCKRLFWSHSRHQQLLQSQDFWKYWQKDSFSSSIFYCWLVLYTITSNTKYYCIVCIWVVDSWDNCL